MGQRLGAFKAKNAQLVIWDNEGRISFEFAKHYKDKQTGQWREGKIIYAEELRQIGEMFLRAAAWSKNKVAETQLPKNTEKAGNLAQTIINKLQERYERSSEDI